jgi:plasmid stabilization system protein ParE
VEQGDELSPDLFDRELAELVHRLETIPHFGTPHPTPRRPGLRRSLLQKTEFHVYFEADHVKQQVRVLTIWHARRGREPIL